MKAALWKYHRILALFLTISSIFCFEFILLNYKYNIFSGGFLQPFSYTNLADRTEFLILSLLFDSFFYIFIASFWFYFLSRKIQNNLLISVYFFISVTSVMGAIIAAKYQLLSYFSDTVNLLILKNLAGGSLKSAMLYAGSEVALAAGGVFFVLIIIYYLVKTIKNSKYIIEYPEKHVVYSIQTRTLLIATLFITGLSIFCVNSASLRYGLSKKISFIAITSSLNVISDVDFDGYGSFSSPLDPEAFDPNIYPGAIDIPGNGIDEDGLLGDAPVFRQEEDSLINFTTEQTTQGKHIVFIVLESARADLLDKKLAGKLVAPNINNIAKNGRVFKHAYSHTGYTTSSLKALFNRELVKSKQESLVSILVKLGYQMSFISGQDESFGNVADEVGMTRDGNYLFDARTAINDRVYASKASASLRLSEERVIEGFKEHAQTINFEQPQFIYFNFQAAHFPYSHKAMKKTLVSEFIPRSKITLEHKEWLTETYWNAIASADWAVGEVISYFDNLGMSEDVTYVILGDHGESLFDDGFLGHGHENNDTQTQIPLIINSSADNVEHVVGQVDIAEIALRAAFKKAKDWKDSTNRVFQIVGTLESPVHISHVFGHGDRITFDFRTEQVYVSTLAEWFDYKELLKDETYGTKISDLILYWEKLRWINYLSNTQN